MIGREIFSAAFLIPHYEWLDACMSGWGSMRAFITLCVDVMTGTVRSFVGYEEQEGDEMDD